MSNEILDDLSEIVPPKYAKKSFWQLRIGAICYIGLVIAWRISGSYLHADRFLFGSIAVVLGIVGSIFTAMGIFNGLKSIRTKEKRGRKGYSGLIFSTVVFFAMGAILYAYTLKMLVLLKEIIS